MKSPACIQGASKKVSTEYIDPDKKPTVAKQNQIQQYGTIVFDYKGRTERIHIVRPLGMGLDEQAVDVVSRYQFAPATLQGKPVPVRINIEVNFRIY